MHPKVFRLARYPYEEAAHYFVLSVSDGRRAGSSEFYADSATILALAEKLASFPRSVVDEVRFESGDKSDPRFSGYTGLRFYVHDASGHTALRVEFLTRGNDLVTGTVDFCFAVEASAINRIGAGLKAFMASDREEIVVEL
ncbi:MAG TPA: hypothetical protein VHE10_01265 [Candidatus Paceibacterota bacterium]|nr:hypothetical protein [Candidatus Paceibacterota bacterium]